MRKQIQAINEAKYDFITGREAVRYFKPLNLSKEGLTLYVNKDTYFIPLMGDENDSPEVLEAIEKKILKVRNGDEVYFQKGTVAEYVGKNYDEVYFYVDLNGRKVRGLDIPEDVIITLLESKNVSIRLKTSTKYKGNLIPDED